MNIFKWIRGRAGKMALSAIQTMGLSAVVGAAGIAAWQYLGSPAETNNTFTPAAYNPGEVVYVAGANTGSYAGGSYAGGGESASSVQISTNTFRRLEQQEMARQAEAEMAEYAPDYSSAVSAPAQAYQMGGTEGLGTGANAVNEFDLKNNPMAAMQQQIKGVSDIVARAQQQAQPQPPAPAPAPRAPQGLPTLASASKNWGSSAATGGSSGNAFNSSFSVQDSGKNVKGMPRVDPLTPTGDVRSPSQLPPVGPTGGARLAGRSSFGKVGLDGNRNATVRRGINTKDANDLEFIRRRSADAAKNKNRAAVEGARAFLASTRVSGGMIISADNVTTGQGQGSRDFEQDYQTHLRGIKNWGGPGSDILNYVDNRDEARHKMQLWFWVALGVSTAAIIAIPFLKKIPVCGWWLALALGVTATAFCAVGFAKATSFAKNYGSTGYSKMAQICSGFLVAGVWLSFFIQKGAKELIKKVPKFLGMKASVGTAIGGGFLGLGAGGLGGSLGGGKDPGVALQGSEEDGK